MTSPGWGAAIGCAILLLIVNSALWLLILGAASSTQRSSRSGIKLPVLMKSDEAWRAGHAVAYAVMVPYLTAALLIALVSIPLQVLPSIYVAVLCASLVCSLLALLLGTLNAVRAAQKV